MIELRSSESTWNEFKVTESLMIDNAVTESKMMDSTIRAVAVPLNINLDKSGQDQSGSARCGKSEYALYSDAIRSRPR